MNPLLLLLLVGGGGYVAYKTIIAPSGSEGASGPLILSGPLLRDPNALKNALDMDRLYGRNPTAEKFMDPIFRYWNDDSPPRPYTIGVSHPRFLGEALWRGSIDPDGDYRYPIGYEYLASVPLNAEARIAAMRAKVKSVPEAVGSPVRDSLIKRSKASLQAMADQMAIVYQKAASNGAKASEIAKTLGVDPNAVTAEAKDMLSTALASSQDYVIVEKAIKSYGPIAQKAVKEISDFIQIGTSDMSAKEKAVNYIKLAADLSMAIPVYGWIVGSALSIVSGVFQGEIDASNEARARELSAFRDAVSACMTKGVYMPWHATDVPASAGFGRFNPTFMLQATVEFIDQLPSPLRTSCQRWWGTAVTYMAHPKVRDIMAAMCNDMAGGTIASDEQVLAVAAPIAISYGFDPYDLATELWKTSYGWAKVDAVAHKAMSPLDQPWIGPNAPNSVQDELMMFNKLPRNAWLLQFAVLAEDCFAIAEKWKATGAPLQSLSLPKGFKLG